MERGRQAARAAVDFNPSRDNPAWDFVTLTTWPEIQDILLITVGPYRTGYPYPWVNGVTLLLDDTCHPRGAVVMKGRLQSRTITLPLRALLPPGK